MSESSKATAVGFEGQSPILPVRDLAKSVDYYVCVLGFKLDWQTPGIFASVSRGRAFLFLCEGDQGHPGTWVWIGVEDAAALFKEYQQSGAKIRLNPTNYQWTYEMQVEDLDGNILRMGSEPLPNQPIGEWLDMHGRRWQQQADGSFKRVD